MNKSITLSDGEWKLMNLLWQREPMTIGELVEACKGDSDWTKNTIYIMLTRMQDKGVVRVEEGGRRKLFYAELPKDAAAKAETECFLKKVYNGSLGMMVASMAGQNTLSKNDIDELYDILRRAEQEVE